MKVKCKIRSNISFICHGLIIILYCRKNVFTYLYERIFQICQNFVKWNLETISQTDDFGHFDGEVFISLLQQNDLAIENEMALYQ